MRADVNILGVGISPVNMRSAQDRIDGWIKRRERSYVCVCTVHTVMQCQRSQSLRQTLNAAGMVTPDGMPLVWLSRLAGHPEVARVYGPDLMLAVMASSPLSGHRHYLYGGREGVATRLAEVMRSRFPGVQVVGTLTPPFAPVEQLCDPTTVRAINEAKPDVVWVGMTAPKQERWMALMREQLEAPVLIGVGAAFDFHTGLVRQAPRWMQKSGLEWLFRLLMEPRRLWRRYLIDNPWFIFEVLRQALGLKSYSLD